LAAEAVGIGPGDKVFVPTMTFTASAEIIRYLGGDPVFLDVEYGSCLLTPEILEAGIKRCPGAKAVVVVHFGGRAARMEQGAGSKEQGGGGVSVFGRGGGEGAQRAESIA